MYRGEAGKAEVPILDCFSQKLFALGRDLKLTFCLVSSFIGSLLAPLADLSVTPSPLAVPPLQPAVSDTPDFTSYRLLLLEFPYPPTQALLNRKPLK